MTKLRATTHRVVHGDSRDLRGVVADESVNLVVTSPPYPMVEMWDGLFSKTAPAFARAFDAADWNGAFEAAHCELDRTWAECHRVLSNGGFACINVGDATRSFQGNFRLFVNHARVVTAMLRIGFTPLPDVLWRKPTNAPNKFMGSGMLPAGAYVTYEHESILIFRKGPHREFPTPDARRTRLESAYFWEERNAWFSDVWSGLVGARQSIDDGDARERSAAFPFEIPYRLIQMFSVRGDTVLDPFAGMGTTIAAALASGRDGICVERDAALIPAIRSALLFAPGISVARNAQRLADHQAFVAARIAAGRPPKHENAHYGFPVMTRQEAMLLLEDAVAAREGAPGVFQAEHAVAKLREGDTGAASKSGRSDPSLIQRPLF